MAAIWAGRQARAGDERFQASGDHAAKAPIAATVATADGGALGLPPYKGTRILLLDSARHLGAKILVAGGGRCNVTHDVVVEDAFAGSSRHAIKKVLRRFDVPRTIEFFQELGVELKCEETGKLFPTTDKARTVLEALLGAAETAHVAIRKSFRINEISKVGADYFLLRSLAGTIEARRVILATGGRSLPKTGSDGQGYEIARSLGHTITPRVFPGLVPLTLPKDHWICALSGLSVVATLQVRSGTGKRLIEFTDSTLCTHFGLSGPSVLDISRYYTNAKMDDPNAHLIINWLPGKTIQSVDGALMNLGKISPGRWLREFNSSQTPRGLPERLAKVLCDQADVDPSAPAHQLTREKRRALASLIVEGPLPISGDRGYNYAEVTAGGVPLSDLHLDTMESRIVGGLHLCGEICDVDGRIGGYNFQWAWASGFVAGQAAASALGARGSR